MPVPDSPNSSPSRLLRTGLGCILLLAAIPAFPRGPEPPLRIPLQNLGFQPLSSQFLLNGSSMLTLHYVDDKHLLVTFVVHRLIPRVVDDPEDDQDRVVDALLLEIPTGNVLARTSWHLHDHAQYLWNLGHGHFLLRIRDSLTTIAPLANISEKEPFRQHPFLVSSERRLAALILSPEADLLIIESIKRIAPEDKPKTPLFGPATALKSTETNPVQINFYRLHAGDDGGPVNPSFAGAVQTRNTGDLPVTTAGYLAIVDQGRQHWAFDFHTFAGKINELSPFDSTCSPAPLFVSHSEFIAFGCRSGQARQQIGGFNMRGQEMWEQGLFGDFIAPSMTYAPAGGRFALSRVLLKISAVPDQPISADEVTTQSVVVYQTNTGKQLLRADCSPVERAGQNFTLSPNGLALAVVHADAIEIYNLPPLSTKDEAELKLAQASAPEENNLPVHFSQAAAVSTADADSVTPSNPQPATTPAPAAPSDNANLPVLFTPSSTQLAQPPPPVTQVPATQSPGDAPPEQHRTPPTLYTLPNDKTPVSAKPKETPQ